MSDPVAKDVEDVLSSIRRLVSDTGPDGSHGIGADDLPADMQEPARQPDVREALILTSALRVAPSEDVTGEDVSASDGAAVQALTGESVEETAEENLNEEYMATKAAADVADETPTPDALQDQTEGELGRSDLGSLRQAVSGAFMGEPVMPAVIHKTPNVKKAADVSSAIEATKSWAPRAPEDYYEDEELAAPDMAGWEDEAVADPAEETPQEAADRHGEAVEVETDTTSDVHAFREDAPEQGEDWSDEVEPEMAELSPEDPLAEFSLGEEPLELGNSETAEAAGAQKDDISDEYEWDEQEEELEDPVNIATFRHVPIDAYRAEPAPVQEPAASETATMLKAAASNGMPAAEMSSDEGTTEDVQGKADEESLKTIDLSDLDEAVLDEETLRELVSDIVRKELSGELGERITRNVRKLVRREIHRALLTREFD